MVGDRVLDAARIFQSKTSPSNALGDDSNSSSKVSSSILDVWEKRIKNVVGGGRSHKVPGNLRYNLLVDISQLTLEPGLGCCWVWQLRVIAY